MFGHYQWTMDSAAVLFKNTKTRGFADVRRIGANSPVARYPLHLFRILNNLSNKVFNRANFLAVKKCSDNSFRNLRLKYAYSNIVTSTQDDSDKLSLHNPRCKRTLVCSPKTLKILFCLLAHQYQSQHLYRNHTFLQQHRFVFALKLWRSWQVPRDNTGNS